jgi:hypothetical protein
MNVRIKLMVGASALALALTMMGCSSDDTSNANTSTSVTTTTNSNTGTKASVETPATNTEYDVVKTTENGVTTVTRTYKNNPRISKVVITERNGQRTATVYNASGEHKDLPSNDLDNVLDKTGDVIANAAGFVADKSKDVGEKTVEGGKTVVEKTGEGAKTIGEKTAEGAKTVGEKTAEGAKKTGKALKNAVTH